MDEPIDTHGGPDEAWNQQPEEMTQEERERATYLQRLFDEAGADTAYDLGLSKVRMPAPDGGWPASTPYEQLIP